MSENNEMAEEVVPAPKMVPRAQRRKPKLRYTIEGLLYSKTFWFNFFVIFAYVVTEMTPAVRIVFGDRVTDLLILVAGVVNMYLRTRTDKPTAAKTEKGLEDIEAAKYGQ